MPNKLLASLETGSRVVLVNEDSTSERIVVETLNGTDALGDPRWIEENNMDTINKSLYETTLILAKKLSRTPKHLLELKEDREPIVIATLQRVPPFTSVEIPEDTDELLYRFLIPQANSTDTEHFVAQDTKAFITTDRSLWSKIPLVRAKSYYFKREGNKLEFNSGLVPDDNASVRTGNFVLEIAYRKLSGNKL